MTRFILFFGSILATVVVITVAGIVFAFFLAKDAVSDGQIAQQETQMVEQAPEESMLGESEEPEDNAEPQTTFLVPAKAVE